MKSLMITAAVVTALGVVAATAEVVAGSKQFLPFPGGRVKLPQAQNWKIGSMPAGGWFAARRLSSKHTIAATVQYKVAKSNAEAFAYLSQSGQILGSLLNSIHKSLATDGVNLEFFTSSWSKWNENECLDYRADLEHKGQPGRLKGRICVLKDRKGLFLVLLRLEYSERRQPSDTDTEYPRFDDEARQFLNGIVVSR